MTDIRPFCPGDEPALAEICVKTADAGGDATGLFRDDALWADVFVLPYVARHPDFAFVVETDDGRIAGYIVGAPDTEAFERWFATSWWPSLAGRYPLEGAGERERGTIEYAAARGPGRAVHAEEYPAHLHIDLLPELQGQGFGRRLIDTLVAALEAQGVPGIHLVAASENEGAILFYPRVGFTALPSEPGTRAFGRRLR
ncbi:MAG TPA: GNAT family N-acetyltransferase [Microbacterium sp.]|uniref:GNAT family N-acetyltransferase n=1 Tax=Microbacterium sp. TaxID=51671 RepID=UPI002CFED1D6|nr:GNAT family N-acetyltransferase [Microbacterium sp.]HWI31149.1 GNAT family N-acetyltransferase [Microbacterium sp.]